MDFLNDIEISLLGKKGAIIYRNPETGSSLLMSLGNPQIMQCGIK